MTKSIEFKMRSSKIDLANRGAQGVTSRHCRNS